MHCKGWDKVVHPRRCDCLFY